MNTNTPRDGANWTPFRRISYPGAHERRIAAARNGNVLGDIAAGAIADVPEVVVWRNSLYDVEISRRPWAADTCTLIHLAVTRLNGRQDPDWHDLQRIKNELVGHDAEAVELYPAESRRAHAETRAHLWAVVANDGSRHRWPIGYPGDLTPLPPVDPA